MPEMNALLSVDADTWLAIRVALASNQGMARTSLSCSLFSPSSVGFFVLSGVSLLLDAVAAIQFDRETMGALIEMGLVDPDDRGVLSELSCDITAAPDGTVVFPDTPVLVVEGPFWQAELVANLASKIIGEATSHATRASRMRIAGHGEIELVDVGSSRVFDREHSLMLASAVYLGGASTTTNVEAAKAFGIPLSARQSVLSLVGAGSIREGFRNWLRHAPQGALIRFDPSQASITATELAEAAVRSVSEEGNDRTFAVEIPGGDYADLAKTIVTAFAQEGIDPPWLYLSGLLDEWAIASLAPRVQRLSGVCIDICRLPALATMRASLSAIEQDGRWEARLPSRDVTSSDPGRKIVVRYFDADGRPVGDVLYATSERLQSPRDVDFVDRTSGNLAQINAVRGQPLLVSLMRSGKRTEDSEALAVLRARSVTTIDLLSPHYRELEHPARYPVGLTKELYDLKTK